jgi:hypothetical protein
MKIRIVFLFFLITAELHAQFVTYTDTALSVPVNTGWSDEAVTIGYLTAPTAVILMFVSGLVSDWNAGYVGIPATALILAAPPLIYLGGRSVEISRSLCQPRAKLGWVLYGLSILPAGFSMYSYARGEGINIPLILASGALGSAAIVTMTTYAYARGEYARSVQQEGGVSWNFGLIPVRGGAVACVSFRF